MRISVWDRGLDGSYLKLTTKALGVFAEAGFPLARQRFAGDTFPQLMIRYQSIL